MRKKLPAILTLLGAFLAVGVVLATDLVDPAAEGVSAPYLIAGSRVTPSYPPAAYAAKYAGVVKLRATVNADGSVGSIEILDSSAANMGFEQAALDAVTQWQFEPARQGGSTVDSFTEIQLRFNPPSRSSRGFVASAFGSPGATTAGAFGTSSASSAGAISTAMSAKAPGGTISTPRDSLGKNRTAVWLPTEFRIPQKYGRPPAQYGAIYDSRKLIPPGTGMGHWLPK